ANVLLPTDRKSAEAGLITDSETPVLGEGTGDPAGREAEARPLLVAHRLEPGDEVVTCGLSHIFPKGVPIGVIEEVRDDAQGLKQLAVLRRHVDFTRLDWVTVILDGEDGEVRWWPEDEAEEDSAEQ